MKDTPIAHKHYHNNSNLITPTKIPKTVGNQGVIMSALNQLSKPKDIQNNDNYLSSRPIHSPGLPVINLFNDESIQELDTEENSKYNISDYIIIFIS